MIKAIIFDCFGVLYPDASWDFFNSLKDTGKLTREKLLVHNEQADLGKLSEEEYYKYYSEQTGIPVQSIKDGVYANFSPNKEVFEVLKKMASKYQIGLVTNATVFDMFMLKRDGVEKYLDSIIVSASVGVTKPSPKIYHLSAEELGVEPEQCIFIDDRQRNLDGATKVGMKCVLFKNAKQLNQELKRVL